jgi:hypothetical protein
MTEEICKHEGCTCTAGENGYCSEYCANHAGQDSDDSAPHECGCGHAVCDTVAAAE